MRLQWIRNNFICRELYAPFQVEKDADYVKDLSGRYSIILKQAVKAGADEDSLKIIRRYKKKILESLDCYYRADIEKSNIIIKNLLKDIGNNRLAVSSLSSSYAFPGMQGSEIQFFRCRTGNPSNTFSAIDMLHLPQSLRAKSGNYRFSIPGNPSLYLANSSYGCWIETGFPADIDFNVSPVILDGSQIIFNLAISIREFFHLNDFESSRVHTWIKLFMLTIATSYIVKEAERTFKSEYIISQSIMMACKKLGYSGIAYYSKRVTDEVFARCAINLALFVNYDGEYSHILEHLKIDDAFNYSIYKNLLPSLKHKEYELRSVKNGLVTNIGSYDRQYPYNETEFIGFDRFLFATWRDKPNEKGKDKIPWGVKLD